ncbi:hypothetical protein POJ06DRAFT_246621 [Lipomyces tetrasporus]|uniref:Proteasome inhibitor PI31 subunit n=1 Tax=Lipomyces tetrasporus TaxID=54092 RepID=A0AAD7VUG4_9ASCO|nr:uncharacterized protein POJ06DRAFT_246621 [Lipomyces tetrasporus]KAJ8103117.1 hypothetical protein POJ06DRAFT_246621 [Lipomyces tetrasporus]
MPSSQDPLRLSNVIDILRRELAQAESSRQISSPIESLALICHSAMLAVGFQFLGTDEDNSNSGPLPSVPSSQSHFSFRYKHNQSSLSPFLLTVSKLGPKCVISALSQGNDEHTFSFDVRITDIVPSSLTFPMSPTTTFTTSEESVSNFINAFKKNIIQALIPSLQKEGYTEERAESEQDSHDNLPPPPYSDRSAPERPSGGRLPPPLAGGVPLVPRPEPVPGVIPRHPAPAPMAGPPGFEDEYEILSGPRGALPFDGRSPFSIGDDDLNPPGLGSRPGLTPGLTGPYYGGEGMRGMYPSDDHPLFAGRRSNSGAGLGAGGIRPPGARWDEPFDPSGGLGDGAPGRQGGRGRFPNGGGFPGGGGFGSSGGFGGGFI